MGKTRLIGEFTAAARGAGVRVLTGACLELGADGLPYSPFTAMLRDLVREVGARRDRRPAVRQRAGRQGTCQAAARADRRPARGRHGRTRRGAAAVDGRRRPTRAGQMTAGEARAHLFEGFLTLLERLAEQAAARPDHRGRALGGPLQPGPARLPHRLPAGGAQPADRRDVPLRRAAPHPSAAAAARRAGPDRLGGQDRAAPAHPRAGRGTRRRRPGPAPERGLADAIYERAQGNPLFTEELLACADGCDMVPDSLADLLLQAVRRLPEDTQEVLRVASAGSGVTSDALLAQVTGLDAGKLIAAHPPGRGGERPGDERGRVLIQARAHPGGGARGPAARRARRGAHPVRPRDRRRPRARLPGPGGHREGAPLVLGAQHDGRARRVVAGLGAGIERGRARGAADAARPRPRAVGAGAGRRGADRRRPRAGARGGGGRRGGRRRSRSAASPSWSSRSPSSTRPPSRSGSRCCSGGGSRSARTSA